MHYLVKPYEEKELSGLTDEILSRIPSSGKYLDVKVSGSNVQIPFQKIVFAEHFSHMIHIHTTRKKEVLTRQSFEAFTSLLKVDPRFYLCNRGIVINLEHAVDFDGKEFLLDDETRIPVSRQNHLFHQETYGKRFQSRDRRKEIFSAGDLRNDPSETESGR